jgi:hypothetical protein
MSKYIKDAHNQEKIIKMRKENKDPDAVLIHSQH